MVQLIKNLSHVCYSSPDLEGIIKFYCEILGGCIIHEFVNPKGQRYGVFIEVGNRTFLEFFNVDQRPTDGGLLRHICFEVDNIQQWIEHLKSKGIETEAHRSRSDKTLQCWIDDPDGNKIEFHAIDQESLIHKYLESKQGSD
jgi:catechol 2,3-dioxygenase-like lactoylglutathione lyase family enzyme